MKPLVAPGKAYFCTVLSAFGIVILSFIGWLFKVNHESMMGSVTDPLNNEDVAATVWGAAFIYFLFFVFCGMQIFFIKRQSRIQL